MDRTEQDALLALAADVVDDLEKVRIANENRLRQLTRVGLDSDGEERGFGLTTEHPDVRRLASLVDALAEAEAGAVKNLEAQARRHPLGPFIKKTPGLGEKRTARLLAAIGDPYWNTLYDRPRTVSELWAFCGYHVLRTGQAHLETQLAHAGAASTDADQAGTETHATGVGVAPKRVKNKGINWSPAARMRAYNIVESCVMARSSPYRAVYERGREKYEGAVHAAECRQCSPKGQSPAPPGSALKPGHCDARARRLVAKEVLKDLWVESKRLHEEVSG